MFRSAQQWLTRLELLARADERDDLRIDERVAGVRRQAAGDGFLQRGLKLPALCLGPVDVDEIRPQVEPRPRRLERDLIAVRVVEVRRTCEESLTVERDLDARVDGPR